MEQSDEYQKVRSLESGRARTISERDQKLTSRIEPIQEHCDRTKIKKGFA